MIMMILLADYDDFIRRLIRWSGADMHIMNLHVLASVVAADGGRGHAAGVGHREGVVHAVPDEGAVGQGALHGRRRVAARERRAQLEREQVQPDRTCCCDVIKNIFYDVF